MSFFRGVIKGAAKSLDRNITEQMDFLKNEASSVAKIRANRAIREQDKYTDALEQNLKEIKDLSIKVGGTDQYQYLVDKHGADEAKLIAQELYEFSRKDPYFNIKEQLNLEKRDGPSVSALELARFMTPKAKVVPSGGYGIGTGMTRIFGMDADAQIKAQSDRLIRAAGIPTNDTKYTNNMPDVLKGSGVPTWRTIRSSRPLQDYNILTSLAASKLEEGTASNNPKLIAEAKSIQTYAETRRIAGETTAVNKPYSDTEYARFRAVQSNYLSETVLGLADGGQYGTDAGGTFYVTGKMDQKYKSEIHKAISSLGNVASAAKDKGIDAVTIANMSNEALNQNKKLVFGNDGELVLGDTQLYDRSVFPIDPTLTIIEEKTEEFDKMTKNEQMIALRVAQQRLAELNNDTRNQLFGDDKKRQMAISDTQVDIQILQNNLSQ